MAVEQDRPRSPVLDLSRPAAPVQAELEVSEAAEVLMSVCALGDERGEYHTYDLGADWLSAKRDAVPAAMLETVDRLMLGGGKLAAHLLGIVLDTPPPRTFAAFRAQLEATEPLEVKLHLLGRYTGATHLPPPEVIELAASGDEEAGAAFLAPLAEYGDKLGFARDLLALPAEELKGQLLDLLPRWHELVFLPTEPEWRAAAERDAESKRALARNRPPEQLVELTTRGYQYVPSPDIRRLVFFPSWWMRPWVILWEHKSAKIFGYPIAAPAEEGVSPAEIARVYKALGDEGRLKLLRRLSEGPLRLTDAAAELGVAKSTAHHHLALLRQAGFVLVRTDDESVYSLRHDLLPQAGDLLGAYLGSFRSSATSA